MLQAATQINEMTLSFIPKLLVLVLALSLAGPWMLQLISNFTKEIFASIPSFIA
ncbi:MAG: flagellar biosynthetic protein FliQ, partial [Pseudomonadota bacterium]